MRQLMTRRQNFVIPMRCNLALAGLALRLHRNVHIIGRKDD